MAGLRRIIGQIDSSVIPTKGVSVAQTRVHTETGVGTLQPTAAYEAFTTAFGTPPLLEIDLAGTITRHMAGTTKLSFDIPRVGKGSFSVSGTPAVRFRWQAQGF